MIRVGIVGTNTSHATVFAGLLNGTLDAPPGVDGARVVGVWSSGKEGLSGMHADAAALAEMHDIATVVDQPQDLVGGVDLILILDDLDGGALHPELARPFLEAGVATFIDKPMALNVTEAVELFDLAGRHGAPLMSCSALRFATELASLRRDAIGELSTIVSVGPGDWYNYGIHAVEAAQAVRGQGAEWVQRFASPDRDLTVVGDQTGPRMIIGTLRDAKPPFHLTGYGQRGMAQAEVVDVAGFYADTMTTAVRMAQTGTSPIEPQDTIEVLAILAAGERSGRTGARVQLADVLSGATR